MANEYQFSIVPFPSSEHSLKNPVYTDQRIVHLKDGSFPKDMLPLNHLMVTKRADFRTKYHTFEDCGCP